MMRVYLTRVFHFNAGHRLFHPERPDAWNERVFGPCANPGGHGHNYYLEVTVCGALDRETGRLIPVETFDRIVHERVLDSLDHRNLNEELELRDSPVPTSEVLGLEVWRRLENSFSPLELDSVRVHETQKNSFEIRAAVSSRTAR